MMDRTDLLARLGSLQQMIYARTLRYEEGRAHGLRGIEVKNADLRFVAMIDKALDISECEYRGTTINFLAKPGLNGRNPFDTHGDEALRSIMGGLFFTCGFENICAPYTDAAGKDYPMHGRIRTSPAEHVCHDVVWDDGRYSAVVSGEVREAELFGENLVLRRQIVTRLGEPSILITDQVINEGFTDQPMMFMYHCNLGWPLVSEDSEIIIPTTEVIPRDDVARADPEPWNTMQEPTPGQPESVFIHSLAADGDGASFAAVINDELGIGVVIEFSVVEFPHFMQWKSMAAGDYVIGLEPSNSSVYGRGHHEERGDLHHLGALSSETKHLRFSILTGSECLAQVRARRDALLTSG